MNTSWLKTILRGALPGIAAVVAIVAGVAVLAVAASAADGPVRLNRSIHIRPADTSPRIDGVIDPTEWQGADSTAAFVQSRPYEDAEPTEQTVVYLLQDDEALYVAFRCWSLKHPPTANYTKDEDYVSISFDPFGSKTTGYFFLMFGSGLFWDGLILDDGRDTDTSWEGVWYRAAKLSHDRMEVEFKIPFKTIRYENGRSEWGLQFQRHIASIHEDDYWVSVSQKDDDLVSRWGTAVDVAPVSSGYHFELYPEGFSRYEDFRGQEAKLKPKASMNLKWDLTSQTSLNATTYPDFAQIESDPYSVNLSRYPTYLDEQRPFFIEGTEIFRFSSFAGSGFFSPLNIFYSRRVGKSLDGEAVPIVGGMKLTHKTEDWNLGTLGAVTDTYRKTSEGIDEPRRGFGVLRAKRRVLGNSDVGLLASGEAAGRHDYNYAVGADAGLRRGGSQLILQGGMSNRNGKQGWAFTSGYKGVNGKLLTMGTYEAIGDSFDVRDVGFVPWTGRQQFLLMSGPFWTPRSGPVRNVYLAPGIFHTREPGSPHWSTLGYFIFNPSLRSNWGCDLEGTWGRSYEYDDLQERFVGYTGKSLSFSFHGLALGNNVNGGCSYSYGYNYRRHYLAVQGQNRLSFSYSICPPLSTTLGGNLWVEWDPDNRVEAMTPLFRPRIDCRITPYMTLSVFNELVGSTPGSIFSKTRVQSDRLGMLYSWNFAPKSWIYVALNDYSALETDPAHPAGMMKRQYAIGAVKAKYLLYL
jgi:hypothetical protein